jgi:S1-C subfamily serine protease
MSAPAVAQDAKLDEALKVARKAQTERVDLIGKLSRTVVAVFPVPRDEREVQDDNPRGAGSGVIIDADGYALTNYLVVRNARRVSVGLSDGRVVGAQVKGIDPTGDIAVIQLEEGPHAFAELGDSDKLQIGERVLAMGNPFSLATDFKPTVSMGIVSGLHRYLPGDDEGNLIYADCIQVDAPLNPGNSGGPLFDAHGRLIGINGRVMGRSVGGRRQAGSFVGFAIPINQIAAFLPDLIAGKDVHHGILGVELANGGPDVKITRVLTDGPADHAGLKPGDIVRSFHGRSVRSMTDLINRIGILPAGKTVKVGIERDGKPMEMDVVLGGRPANGDEAAFEPKEVRPRTLEVPPGRSPPTTWRSATSRPSADTRRSAPSRTSSPRPGCRWTSSARADASASRAAPPHTTSRTGS